MAAGMPSCGGYRHLYPLFLPVNWRPWILSTITRKPYINCWAFQFLDNEFYEQYKRTIKAVALELSNRGQLVDKIMGAFSAYHGNNLQSDVALDN